MDIQIIKELLRKFNTTKECQYLKQIYEQKSFMEILSVNRTEMQHSAFVSWLLEGKDFDCNDQDFPMMHFLDLLLTRAYEEEKDFPTNFSNSDVLERCILARDMTLSKLTICPETFIGSDGRPDIVLTAEYCGAKANKRKLTIVIENKVLSKEGIISGVSQSRKYWEHYFDEYKKERNNHDYIFVYLTPIHPSLLSKDVFDHHRLSDKGLTCDCPHFIHICYQDIVDYIIQPLIDNANTTERIKFILKEYTYSLSIPTWDDKSCNKIVMAMNHKEKQKLEHFWDEFHELVFSTINQVYNSKCHYTPEENKYLNAFWNNNESLLTIAVKSLAADALRNSDWQLQVANAMIDSSEKKLVSTFYYIEKNAELFCQKDAFVALCKSYANVYSELNSADLNSNLHKEKGLPNAVFSDACQGKFNIPCERIGGTIVYIKDDPSNYSQKCENLVKFIKRDSNCMDRIKVFPYIAKY